MTGNSQAAGLRSSRATRASEWRAYDSLPPSVRRALQNAVFDWSSVSVVTHMRQRKLQPFEMPKIIASWDREQIAKQMKSTHRNRKRR